MLEVLVMQSSHTRHSLRPIVIAGAIAGSFFVVPFSLGLDLQKDSPQHEAMSGTMRRDAKIAAAIRAELARENSLSPEAKNVKITAQKGSIFLKGTVATISEKTRVEEIAKKIGKTKLIDNDLVVRGP